MVEDVGIYLNLDYAIAVERAAIRDSADFDSIIETKRITQIPYHGAHKIHAKEAKPIECATFVICNNDPLKASIEKI